MILSELKRHESDFMNSRQHMENQLQNLLNNQRVKALRSLFRGQAKDSLSRAFSKWKIASLQETGRDNMMNLKEDLRQVVTQLNQFRLNLVFSKLGSALARKISVRKSSAFYQIQASSKDFKKRQEERSANRLSMQYKSPFM